MGASAPQERGVGLDPTRHRGAVSLTEHERALLDFERHWWRCGATRADAAQRRFGLDAAEHRRTIAALIDSPAALEHDPVLVRRLRRMRATHRAGRSERRAA